MKYSFLIPFYNRKKEFALSLKSYRHWYGNRKDVELLVGIDIKDANGVGEYMGMNIKIFSGCGGVGRFCPASTFNRLAEAAAGNIFILTNPETMHATDILGWIDRNYPAGNIPYLVFACEAGYVDDFNQEFPIKYRHYLWYQHSKHNNRMLHFCSAISRNMYYGIGGFDEGYSAGIGYDDNDFIRKIQVLGLSHVAVDDQRVIHIEHDRSYINSAEKIEVNRALYEKKWRVKP